MTLDQITGTIGVTLLLAAFFFNQFGFLKADSRSYQSLNASGAALACYASYLIGFVPFVVLEAFWTGFALVALLRRPASLAPLDQ
ncbi:MAG: CBU_0592 family membrane protein [Candidatus Binataceae bacterium]